MEDANDAANARSNWSSALFLAAAALLVVPPLALLPLASDAPKTFWGVDLSMSREEVRYRLGDPPYLFDVVGTCPNGGQAIYTTIADPGNARMPEERRDADFNDWVYGRTPNDHYSNVHFSRGVVVGIGCFDPVSTGRKCPTLKGIRTGDAESKVRGLLGEPTSETLDAGVKTLTYARNRVAFQLEKGRVYGLILGRLQDAPPVGDSEIVFNEPRTRPGQDGG